MNEVIIIIKNTLDLAEKEILDKLAKNEILQEYELSYISKIYKECLKYRSNRVKNNS